jgi:uncharacterized protein
MKPDFRGAKQYVISRLTRELSPHLTYHSLYHTRDDVLPAASRLGRASGLEEEECLLLTTAALFHDTGFIDAYEEHEAGSIAIARAALPDFGYSPAQIERVAELIAATKMPQRPTDRLQELLCDADLDLLGRKDFLRLNHKLLCEVRYFSPRPVSDETWMRDQTRFIEEHHYFSAAAQALRAAGQAKNQSLMRAALASLNGHNHTAINPC